MTTPEKNICPKTGKPLTPNDEGFVHEAAAAPAPAAPPAKKGGKKKGK